MRGGAATMVPLAVGILAGVILLLVLAQITEPLAQADEGPAGRGASGRRGDRSWWSRATSCVGIYLAPARADEQMAVAPQWDVFAIFLVLFLLGVALTIWAMVKAATDRPAPGEQAA